MTDHGQNLLGLDNCVDYLYSPINIDYDNIVDVDTDVSSTNTGNPMIECSTNQTLNVGIVCGCEHEDVKLANRVWQEGYPNVHGARCSVKSNWNLEYFEQMLANYHDKEIIEYLRYGWPANRLPTVLQPTISKENHKSALDHPHFVSNYIQKELEHDALLGPFQEIPFDLDRIAVLPISTRPKRESQDRRTIMDLSFPKRGTVNDWTPKDTCMGLPIKLRYPTVDDLAKHVYELGNDCYMWKHDFSRCFKQIPLDPGDYALFGFVWEGLYYWDKTLVMGHRVAPYICQRITNMIKYIHTMLGMFLLNYIDDFLGAEKREKAQEAYELLGTILQNLGAQEAENKAVPLTQVIEFLGVTFNSHTMTMEVSLDRISEIFCDLDGWLAKDVFT